ncbi:MAG: mannose-1-phosphate guanylyltransferase/mannose-6-phosphate isomerase [Alphaproteobacteria bacterium]|nr:mannose-1-phosphate guanylyltransferase/mannose-6-phosphate isomerase [Alphaproteobacteria bacterium]
MPVVPAVLCGGAGTRLWPLSREARPKQLLSLVSERSLLDETLERCRGWEDPLLVGADSQRFLLADSVRRAGRAIALLCEPSGRNTAAAACAAALHVARTHPGAAVLLLPADHAVADERAFREAVQRGLAAVEEGRIVVFGVRPDRAATEYGWIRPGASHGAWSEVDTFVEKPDAPTARRYLAAGFLWNAGIFLFRPEVLVEELATHAPEVLEAVSRALDAALVEGPCCRMDGQAWAGCPSVPVDIAVMERTARAAVVPVSMGWEDLGSFHALWERARGVDGNALVGDAVQIGSKGCYVHSEDVLVAVKDVEDLVVVGTPDAVLVTRREGCDALKPLVASLGRRREVLEHPISARPWGGFRVVDAGDGFQVKRIHVGPGERLSLQRHASRDEHWVVVKGAGLVVVGDEARPLAVGEHVDIPRGVAHRIENPGPTELVLVEVQLGDYLGEDDIERLEDAYGRAD